MNKLVSRLKEPSTHAAIAAMIGGTGWLGTSVSEPDLVSIIGGVAMIVTGLAGVFLGEKGGE